MSAVGYILPASAGPANDDALDDVFQRLVVGVTGLPGKMVRPRWQPNPPKQPTPDVNWCAVGVVDSAHDDNAALVHDRFANNGDGADDVLRHEELTVLASFYGPNAAGFADLMRDGLSVPQNREALHADDVAFVAVGDKRIAPDLTNGQWVRRVDLTLLFRRGVKRSYATPHLTVADIDIDNERFITHITT